MDASLLSPTSSTRWYIALIDELVDGLRQSHPDANWTNLPPLSSEIFVAKPQILYVRAASCTTSAPQALTLTSTANSHGNSNSNGSGNSNSNGSGNSNSNGNNGSTNSNDSTQSGGNNNTTLIAAVAGAVGGCLLLAGIIFFFYRRHVKHKLQPPAPASIPNPTMLDSTPIAGGKAHPMQFQGGPMPMATPPSTYVPSSSGDSSSQYNYTAPLSPQWTGTTGATSTLLGHPRPPSMHPSMYYTTPGSHPMTSSSSVSGPPPWAVPMDPNMQQHPQAYLSPSQPMVGPGPSPSPGMEKASFSGYHVVPVHQNQFPVWAVDHKRPGAFSGPSNPAGASGSGTGAPHSNILEQPRAPPNILEQPGASLSNVLEQPGDTLPPPAYSATPSSL